jgi:hypothetical protein
MYMGALHLELDGSILLAQALLAQALLHQALLHLVRRKAWADPSGASAPSPQSTSQG